MDFNLKRPCAKCPFRTDIGPYLSSERADDILRAITDGDGTFACHETTEHNEDGDHMMSAKEQHCAGALILLEKMEQPNQMMRIAEGLGMYDRTKLHMDSPVYEDTDDMLDAFEDAEAA
jgi:hypothetical protein